MDGLTAIRILRQISPDVRIIAASGLSINEGTDDTKLAVSHFLPKPYTAENLLKVMKQILVNKT